MRMIAISCLERKDLKDSSMSLTAVSVHNIYMYISVHIAYMYIV